ncbi:acriflavin resistance protein, partial [Vibrio xuii]
ERRGDTPVPESALMERDGRTYVWRVNQEGIVESVSVTLNESRQVVDGLSDGDKIIISGVREIEAGIKVREWIKERGL